MKHMKLNLGLTLASLVSVTTLAVVPVSARGINSGSGSSGSGSDEVATSQSDDSISADPSTQSTTIAPATDDSGTETESSSGDVTSHHGAPNRLQDIHAQAQKLLAADRKAAAKPDSSAAGRQKACQARSADLNRKVTNFGTQATRHLNSLDTTYAKLKAYQADKKLTAADYDTLVTAADAQKAATTTAVDTLKAVSVNIDCSSADPAASVATVKTAVTDARTSLQSYRAAIKKVLVALMTAKDAASAPTDTTPNTGETNQ